MTVELVTKASHVTGHKAFPICVLNVFSLVLILEMYSVWIVEQGTLVAVVSSRVTSLVTGVAAEISKLCFTIQATKKMLYVSRYQVLDNQWVSAILTIVLLSPITM